MYRREIEKGKTVIEEKLKTEDRMLIYKDSPENKLKSKLKDGYAIKGRVPPDAYIVERNGLCLRLNKKHVKLDTSAQ